MSRRGKTAPGREPRHVKTTIAYIRELDPSVTRVDVHVNSHFRLTWTGQGRFRLGISLATSPNHEQDTTNFARQAVRRAYRHAGISLRVRLQAAE